MKKTLKRISAAMLALALLLSCNSAFALTTGAKGAVLIEAQTGKVLFSSNPHKKLPMASTTKIMTALVAIERGNLDEIVTTDASAYGVEGSSIYLHLEEEISLRDLLFGLMLSSGNDAAVAIAIHIGKSVAGFADLMNLKARELGAFNTHFVTPNGLHDEEHYTTAYDLALITAAAMKNETFREIVSTEYHRTETGAVQRTFKNKNKLLWEYEGGNGVKTGYTMAAGKCLVFSAQRDEMEIIGVVLNCPNMFPEAKEILSYGFDNFETATLIAKGQKVATVMVSGGEKNLLELEAGKDIIIPLAKGSEPAYRTRVAFDEDIHAPVYKGTQLGNVEIVDEDGAFIANCPLVAAYDLPDAGIDFYFGKVIRRFSR